MKITICCPKPEISQFHQQPMQLVSGHAQNSFEGSLRVCASSEVKIKPSDVHSIKFTVVPCLSLQEVMTQTASDAQESQAIFGAHNIISHDF
jgi:hypothetical protein